MTSMDDERPDAERILARIQTEEANAARGRLKIFFGASAGVGKTYAMLEQSRVKQRQGVDVVVGWVETHARKETEALLAGLEMLPPRRFDYRGAELREFDIDAALARRPGLLLLDELAHTNAPGARHTKRWRDVEEILATGIDVYTTVNVQHIESLNDVVAQTTGVVVRETVPDSVIERAAEIELVDLTPDDLLQRMKEGKVYIAAQAERAVHGFFKKENLIALRELAMRHAAEHVDAQMRSYKDDHGIGGVWPVAERILVCVSAGPEGAKVVRTAGRMAAGLRAEWFVAHVERPGGLRQTEADRARIAQTMRLAEQLGAKTTTLVGMSVSEEILAFARARNVTRIVVGKPGGARWRYRLFGSVVEDLIRGSEDVDVTVIRGAMDEAGRTPAIAVRRHSPARSYAIAAAVVAAITVIAHLMASRFELTNVVMIYLLGVLAIAVALGRGPSILASILSVAAFDFFLVPPRLTFAVTDSEYLVTFAVMLVVALLTSTLAVRLRQQADSYRRRQEGTAALYRMSREFARSLTLEEVVASAERHIGDVFACEVWVLLPDARGELVRAPGVTSGFPLDPKEIEVARWVYTHGAPAGLGTATLSSARASYVPLVGARGSVGVIGLFPANEKELMTPETLQHLEAFADQTALVIERALLEREGQEAKLRIEAERLRNLLLSSVSHDLRTPLATITGAASGLLETQPPLGDDVRRELTQSILDEAERLNRLVGNLLTMTSIESGAIQVQTEWQPLDEVVGAALNHMENPLRERPVITRIPDDLPLVPLDGVLIEKVLANLLDNAVKYTPAESAIEISASHADAEVIVAVADNGPGLPPGAEERVFEKFHRGSQAPGRGGVGLGLPICRGIVEAHGGRIWAENREGGGAVFRFALPLRGVPPTVEEAPGDPDGEERA